MLPLNDAAKELADEFREMFPEGRVKKDVEDHVGRGVDHKQELADGKQDKHPGRDIMQSQISARQKLVNADRLVEVDKNPGGNSIDLKKSMIKIQVKLAL